jgi:hypothetical protein
MNFSYKHLLVIVICTSIFNALHAQYNTKVQLADFNDPRLRSVIESNASNMLSILNASFQKKIKPERIAKLSSEAYASLLSMWEMSPFKCLETEIVERAVKRPQGGFEIRNIPVFVQEANEEDQYQEIVLIFNSLGLIDNIYIALESNVYLRLAKEGADVTELTRRQIILDFVENFRTSYNRKDINFLSKVFSEDELIITGREIKVNPCIDCSNSFLPKEKIEYQKFTKAEYISRMRNIFAYNAYLNINFKEIEIKRHPRYAEIYGVSLQQDWNSSSYSDVGYLFMMIDFSNQNEPKTHIRIWQPEKVGGKILSDEEKYQLEHFNLQK